MLERLLQRWLCRIHGCWLCPDCDPLRHCIHCGARDGRFLEQGGR